MSEIVVVDNSCDSFTKDRVAEFSRHAECTVVYVANAHNVGSGAGCMAGVRLLVAADIVFFINPDVFLTRGLSELVDCANSTASIIGARLSCHGNSAALNARRMVTPGRELLKVVVGSRVYSRAYSRLISRHGGPREIEVDQVDGALMGISLADLWRLGGFDRAI